MNWSTDSSEPVFSLDNGCHFEVVEPSFCLLLSAASLNATGVCENGMVDPLDVRDGDFVSFLPPFLLGLSTFDSELASGTATACADESR